MNSVIFYQQQASGNKGRWDHVSSKQELVAKLLSSNKQTTQFRVRVRIAKNTTFLIDRKVSDESLTPILFYFFIRLTQCQSSNSSIQ